MDDSKLQGAEILFGFLGWLTSRKTAVTFSWHHGTSGEAVKLLERFCETNGLSTDCRDHWDDRLTHPPVLEAEQVNESSDAEGYPGPFICGEPREDDPRFRKPVLEDGVEFWRPMGWTRVEYPNAMVDRLVPGTIWRIPGSDAPSAELLELAGS